MDFLRCAGGVRHLALVLACGLAGCGGGGGGGAGGGSGGSGGSATFPEGSISLATSVLQDTTYVGLAAHQKSVQIVYSGDVSALSGHTLYVKVVQPDSVYSIDPFPYAVGTQSLVVNLVGNDAHTFVAGHATGTLQVFVCVDSADCTTQLRNSPLRVDYDIEVRPGLELSTDSVQQSTPYGTAAPARTITVTKPAQAETWSYVPLGTTVAGADPGSLFLVPSWLKRDGDTLTFAPPADLLPGVYALELQFDTVVPDAVIPSQPQRLVRKLLVSHTVTPTGIYVAKPSSVAITQSLAGFPADWPVPSLVSQVGGTFLRLGVRMDSHPAAAEGHPLLANWLRDGRSPNLSEPSYSITYCDFGQLPALCLPEGTYRGAQLMRHTAPGGTVTDFEIPITFTLTP